MLNVCAACTFDGLDPSRAFCQLDLDRGAVSEAAAHSPGEWQGSRRESSAGHETSGSLRRIGPRGRHANLIKAHAGCCPLKNFSDGLSGGQHSYPGPSGEDADIRRPTLRCRITVSCAVAPGTVDVGLRIASRHSGTLPRRDDASKRSNLCPTLMPIMASRKLTIGTTSPNHGRH